MPAAEPAPVLLRGTDRAAFAVAFAARLRRAGLRVGITETGDLVRALGASPPTSRTVLYWTARVSLVRRHDDLALFDRVFATVFDDTPPLPLSRSAVPPKSRDNTVHVPVPGAGDEAAAGGEGLPWATLPTAVAADEDSGDDGLDLPELRPSALAALAAVPFEDLDQPQTEALGAALRAALTDWPHRRGRRHRADPAGRRVALRATIARARRTGWEAITVVRERPLPKPRRVVMLCDVSESMRAQAAAYLQLMRAFTTVADAEVFAFATRLTRLTVPLRHTSPREAVDQAGAAVDDRFGGTRIATNIATLLDSHHGDTVRGGVVIVASDGWDSDPPEAMTAAMTRLRRRAHSILWLNPRAGTPGWAPRVGAMAAALPFCDHLLPAATFTDLTEAIHHLRHLTRPPAFRSDLTALPPSAV
ncbi:VWA domain-containing protein [Actinoplanes sichuanensis]|uniref:VWA domain-containing protein n=1 Tax=Actinoplanes sichuanensis TaxID=512349 RepID=A0ABW3ZZS2_9ACTN|nr:VWA domain-containing protein [Actinoplanes sichuanensis]BEL08176.1 VWA domain-containing protein [Actinoplanes sichuanensis]